MFFRIFSKVQDSMIEGDEDDAEFFLVAFIAFATALIGFIFLLPLALGDDRDSAKRRIWNYKWIYVIYLGIGVTLYLYLSLEMPPTHSVGLGAVVPSLYFGSVVVAKQLGISVPGGQKLAEATQSVGTDEFEIPMVVEQSSGSNRVPTLQKDESTLAIGASRSGKTSALKLLACQIDYDDSKPTIVHGSIGEYSDFYRDVLNKEIIEIGVHSSSHKWNLFREIEEDREYTNLARSLFDESGDYFDTAARQVFAGVLRLLDREFDQPDHRDIKELFERSTADETYQKLCDHSDLQSAAEHLDPDAKEQQRGVWSSVVQKTTDVFVGDFAEGGKFSFREYVENPSGRIVVVESPEVSRGAGPMYQLMLDEGIEKAMQRPDRESFMLLDELDTLPPMDNIGDLAARGLAQNVRMLLGIQTIGQLHDVYGVDGSKAITGNSNQMICLTPGNDEGDTTEFYQSLIGKRRETVKNQSRSRGQGENQNVRKSISEQEKERYPITEHDMNSWDQGEGLVVRRNQWWIGKLDYYERILDRYV